jgi:hypothetical protein
LTLVALAAALTGCGGGDRPAATATAAPTATVTAAPSATVTAAPTVAPTTTATATATATSPEDEPGGAGDEAIARVPVALTIHPDGQLAPPTVAVPAFFTLELIVRNETGAAIAVTFQGTRLEVGSGATVHRRFEGLKKGRYPVRAAGAGTATVIVGVEPGP